MNRRKRIILLALSALGCLSLSQCASGPSGATFQSLAASGALAPKSGQAKVVLYETSGGTYNIWANDRKVTDALERFTFVAFDAAPGHLRLASTGGSGEAGEDFLKGGLVGIALMKKRERIALEVGAGQTYYVELHNGWWQEEMELREKEEALETIQEYQQVTAGER